jgi:mannitol/fructose-specific phosphotransferase system IIA component (Ntr-type)
MNIRRRVDDLKELGTILLGWGRYQSAEEKLRKLAACCQAQHSDDHSKTLSALVQIVTQKTNVTTATGQN